MAGAPGVRRRLPRKRVGDNALHLGILLVFRVLRVFRGAFMSSPELLSRIEAAKRAVLAQTALLHREFGCAESQWKHDGTRVTAVDVAISEGIFRELGAQFPGDQFFSEELAE